MGVYDRPKPNSITEIEIIAGALSALWLLGTAIYFTFIAAEVPEGANDGGLRGLLILLVVILPVAMIWVGATAARAGRVMREEIQRLQAAIDAIRYSYISQQQGNKPAGDSNIARKLDELAASARKTEIALAGRRLTPRPPSPRAPPARRRRPADAGAWHAGGRQDTAALC